MTWLKIVAALALVAALIGGGWYLRGLKCDRDMNAAQNEWTEAELDQANLAIAAIKTEAENMVKSSASYRAYRLNLKGALNEIKTEIARVAAPLPAGCKPDQLRVEKLHEAIDKTNSAIRQ